MKKKILILTTSTIVLFLVFMVFNAYAHGDHSEGDNEDNTMMGGDQYQNQGDSEDSMMGEDQSKNQEDDSMDNESEKPEQEQEEEKEQPEQVEETEQPEVSDEMDSNKNEEDQKIGEDQKGENINEDLNNNEDNEDNEGEYEKKSIERKSNVVNAIAEILKITDKNKDLKYKDNIKKEIKFISIDQVLNQDMIEKSLKEVDNRSSFVIFFIGPKYNKINEASKLVEKNNEHIKKLVEIKSQIKNKDDVQKIEEQVSVLENSTKQVEDYIKKSESAFSLFGWLSRIFSK